MARNKKVAITNGDKTFFTTEQTAKKLIERSKRPTGIFHNGVEQPNKPYNYVKPAKEKSKTVKKEPSKTVKE